MKPTETLLPADAAGSLTTDRCVRSMTGQGAGSASDPLGTVTVELRSVNQRGLRLTAKLYDSLAPLEPALEQLIRHHIKRGSLQITARYQPSAAVGGGTIHADVVADYARQLQAIDQRLGGGHRIDLVGLLQLPGAVSRQAEQIADTQQLWPLLEQATLAALTGLDRMRADEGAAMADQLLADVALIDQQLTVIVQRAPQVVDQYRERLEGRVQRFLTDRGLEFETIDLLREVQLFADRSDIAEEITRLASHLRMFRDVLGGEPSSGRKLDFIIQEMFRETNTIGSKAGDSEIAAAVVEIKCAIERMRELAQNLE